MDYAATRHLMPPPGESDGVSPPWEMGGELSPANQETWLLSFIDILALLLTLFVLLLAYQDRGPAEPGSAVDAVEGLSLPLDFSRQAPNRANVAPLDLLPDVTSAAMGYVMPGEGLLPHATDATQRRPMRAEVVASAPVATYRQAPTAAGAVPARAAEVAPSSVELLGVEQTGEQSLAETAAGTPEPDPVPTPAEKPVQTGGEFGSVPTATDRLLATLKQTALGDRVEMSVHPGAVNLDISDRILFAPASAALSGEGLDLLNELAAILQTLPYQLSVEGHTDNVPIQTARYPSNWELSSARAARVTRKLIGFGVAPERIRAIGYGDTQPRSDNDSAEGRAKNRRVTFVLQVEAGPVNVAETE